MKTKHRRQSGNLEAVQIVITSIERWQSGNLCSFININHQPPTHAKFLCCSACPPPSSCLSFEHSSAKMGSLDIDPVYSTLCPSITSTRSTSKFHFNTFQYSASGLVMLDAMTYGQDCTCIIASTPGVELNMLPETRLWLHLRRSQVHLFHSSTR